MAGEKRRQRLRSLIDLVDAPNLELEMIEPAFVHASASAEQGRSSNERLEFLGDSILGYLTASWLYARYPGATEGELARRKAALASDEAIATTGQRLGLGEVLMLGNGERTSGGSTRPSNVGDAFEALVAILERSVGLEATRRFVEREHLLPLVDQYGPETDAKTTLQEVLQAQFRATPVYIDVDEEGPPHMRTFQARVELTGKVLGTGRGPSKKTAQRAAAIDALLRLKEQAS